MASSFKETPRPPLVSGTQPGASSRPSARPSTPVSQGALSASRPGGPAPAPGPRRWNLTSTLCNRPCPTHRSWRLRSGQDSPAAAPAPLPPPHGVQPTPAPLPLKRSFLSANPDPDHPSGFPGPETQSDSPPCLHAPPLPAFSVMGSPAPQPGGLHRLHPSRQLRPLCQWTRSPWTLLPEAVPARTPRPPHSLPRVRPRACCGLAVSAAPASLTRTCRAIPPPRLGTACLAPTARPALPDPRGGPEAWTARSPWSLTASLPSSRC